MSEKKTETFEHIGTMAKAAEMATVAAVSALPREQSDAFYADLRERKGALEVEFVVNGFHVPFAAFMQHLHDTFDASARDEAAKLIVGDAQKIRDQLWELGETLRCVKGNVESKAEEMFPGCVYTEDR